MVFFYIRRRSIWICVNFNTWISIANFNRFFSDRVVFTSIDSNFLKMQQRCFKYDKFLSQCISHSYTIACWWKYFLKGKVALEKIGIEIQAYYSSEICEKAKAVARKNHGKSVIDVGDARLITEEVIDKWDYGIDFLFGSSPCNDLCRVNPKRKKLDGIKKKLHRGIFLCLKNDIIVDYRSNWFWMSFL